HAMLPAGSTLPVGQPATFTLIVIVTSNAPSGSTISNTATVSSSTDTNPLNDTSNPPVDTSVTVQADLGGTKTSPADVNAGDTFTYLINVTNHGPSDEPANPVAQLSDALPAHTTFVS